MSGLLLREALLFGMDARAAREGFCGRGATVRQAVPQAACTFFPVVAELVRTKNHFVVGLADRVSRGEARDALERTHAFDPLDGGALCLPRDFGECLLLAVFAVKQLRETVKGRADDTATQA